MDYDEEDERIISVAANLLPEVFVGYTSTACAMCIFTSIPPLLYDNDECKTKDCVISYFIV